MVNEQKIEFGGEGTNKHSHEPHLPIIDLYLILIHVKFYAE